MSNRQEEIFDAVVMNFSGEDKASLRQMIKDVYNEARSPRGARRILNDVEMIWVDALRYLLYEYEPNWIEE